MFNYKWTIIISISANITQTILHRTEMQPINTITNTAIYHQSHRN